ncbi:MAG: glutaredoxin family protein [Nitrospira sp.]|nr:glutaredoxin family protein [Nitrospira sp.]MDH4244635.1 glutaredoxin family protein [Nitrospira sp.]MDH4355177.1 glutaredoxin family protein [Nitrospira sp.]MDH5317526.1 glutaredoxin family protein [Nitrospira sp.]
MSFQRTAWHTFFRQLATHVFVIVLALPASAWAGEAIPDIEVFVRAGCPHCEAAKIFLDDLRRERPSLHIALYDIAEDPAARQRLEVWAKDRGITTLGVPAFLIGTELILGFQSSDTTGAKIRAMLDRKAPDTVPGPSVESIETGWFGSLRVRDLGLPLFTIVIGLLDGFNPCAMWVLLFLLSLLVNLQDRRKMALIAGTFVIVSGLLYFAFMAAWLNVFLVVGLSRALQIGLGGIALFIGTVNVKDFFALHQGLSLSIPESAKPGLYARIRRILQADNLAGALVSVIVLAGLVNTIELLCTAGFPAVYTQILTMQQLPTWNYYGYLGLYNLAYILDDGLMVTIAVVTLSRRKLQERAGRWLKLASGLVMAGLGAILLLSPEWLI